MGVRGMVDQGLKVVGSLVPAFDSHEGPGIPIGRERTEMTGFKGSNSSSRGARAKETDGQEGSGVVTLLFSETLGSKKGFSVEEGIVVEKMVQGPVDEVGESIPSKGLEKGRIRFGRRSWGLCCCHLGGEGRRRGKGGE